MLGYTNSDAIQSYIGQIQQSGEKYGMSSGDVEQTVQQLNGILGSLQSMQKTWGALAGSGRMNQFSAADEQTLRDIMEETANITGQFNSVQKQYYDNMAGASKPPWHVTALGEFLYGGAEGAAGIADLVANPDKAVAGMVKLGYEFSIVGIIEDPTRPVMYMEMAFNYAKDHPYRLAGRVVFEIKGGAAVRISMVASELRGSKSLWP